MNKWTGRKMNEDSKKYKAEAIKLAMRFAPRIYPCVDCGRPVADGYCCNNCGSDNPKGTT